MARVPAGKHNASSDMQLIPPNAVTTSKQSCLCLLCSWLFRLPRCTEGHISLRLNTHKLLSPSYRKALPLSAVQEAVCSRHSPTWCWNHLTRPAWLNPGPLLASRAVGKDMQLVMLCIYFTFESQWGHF